MLRVRWLLFTALVTLVVVGLLQPANGQSKKPANQNRGGGTKKTRTGGGGGGSGGTGTEAASSVLNEVKGASTNTLLNFSPKHQGKNKRRHNTAKVSKGHIRAAGILGRGKPEARRLTSDSRRVRRASQRDRRANWRKRTPKNSKKNKINEERNSTFSVLFEEIKNQTKDLIDDLKEQAKEEIKKKAKEAFFGLLTSITTDIVANTLCDCQKLDCECCVDWGVLGSGCLKVEIYNKGKEPGIDLIIGPKCGPELASITLSSQGGFGEDNMACFNMIPFVTDACIVPDAFTVDKNKIEGSFNVTVDAFSVSSNYRIIYKGGANASITGTPFILFGKS